MKNGTTLKTGLSAINALRLRAAAAAAAAAADDDDDDD